jgi:hypothetical protein
MLSLNIFRKSARGRRISHKCLRDAFLVKKFGELKPQYALGAHCVSVVRVRDGVPAKIAKGEHLALPVNWRDADMRCI